MYPGLHSFSYWCNIFYFNQFFSLLLFDVHKAVCVWGCVSTNHSGSYHSKGVFHCRKNNLADKTVEIDDNFLCHFGPQIKKEFTQPFIKHRPCGQTNASVQASKQICLVKQSYKKNPEPYKLKGKYDMHMFKICQVVIWQPQLSQGTKHTGSNTFPMFLFSAVTLCCQAWLDSKVNIPLFIFLNQIIIFSNMLSNYCTIFPSTPWQL